MNNPYQDKVEAKGQQLQAKIEELQGKLKEATADARIAIQKQIDTLQKKL